VTGASDARLLLAIFNEPAADRLDVRTDVIVQAG
jgi:hypothetical protein